MTSIILGLAAMLTFTPSGQAGTVTAQQPAGKLVERRPVMPDELTNVRLDLTITDKTSAADSVKKAVTLLIANGGDARVRSHGTVLRNTSGEGAQSMMVVTLNADASINTISGDKVRAAITVEYAPSTEGSNSGATAREQRGSTLNQSVMVVLTNGKPTVIVESSDPLSDRKVTLEATATILR
jgi:hypothetical protein